LPYTKSYHSMATYKNGINGPFKGKVGSVVGSSWKGIDYLKGLPKKSTKPVTEKTKATRSSFAFVHKWLNPIQELVKIGFANYHPHMSGRNAALSYNLTKALIRRGDDFEIDYPVALFSYGKLPGVAGLNINMKDAQTLLISWDPKSTGGDTSPSDALMSFVYCPELFTADARVGQASRNAGQAELLLPGNFTNKRIEVQIAFKSIINDGVSTSQYAGCLRLDLAKPENGTLDSETAASYCAPVSIGNGFLLGR